MSAAEPRAEKFTDAGSLQLEFALDVANLEVRGVDEGPTMRLHYALDRHREHLCRNDGEATARGWRVPVAHMRVSGKHRDVVAAALADGTLLEQVREELALKADRFKLDAQAVALRLRRAGEYTLAGDRRSDRPRDILLDEATLSLEYTTEASSKTYADAFYAALVQTVAFVAVGEEGDDLTLWDWEEDGAFFYGTKDEKEPSRYAPVVRVSWIEGKDRLSTVAVPIARLADCATEVMGALRALRTHAGVDGVPRTLDALTRRSAEGGKGINYWEKLRTDLHRSLETDDLGLKTFPDELAFTVPELAAMLVVRAV